jgi:hypothetical protein
MIELEHPLWFFLIQPIGDLLGDQRGVAAGSVVDDEIDLDLVFLSLVYDLCRVLGHLRIQHSRDHFVGSENYINPE